MDKELMTLEPRNMEEVMKMAEYLSKSTIIPKDFQGKPENVFIAISMGREIGLKALTSLQSIYVVNGRPSIWGDALWALIKTNIGEGKLVEYARESFDESDPKNPTAICEIKTVRDDKPVIVKFSQADATKAKLWSKAGPWQEYWKRMLQYKARTFAARDACPELLKGLAVVEEMQEAMPTPKDAENPFMPEAIEADTVTVPENTLDPENQNVAS